jgi:hypothetical protein
MKACKADRNGDEYYFLINSNKGVEMVMLSSLSRTLTYLSAVCYLLLGTILFFAPEWGASRFAWNVSPFLVMTIGGWCLGTSAFALLSARIWRWPLVFPSLLYLWLFGILQGAVLIGFRAKVNLDSPLAIGYVATIGISVLTALVGAFDLLRLRPRIDVETVALQPIVRLSIATFSFLVGVIALSGVFARPDGFLATGGIFPENLTLFTIYAFAAFFAALSLSASSMLLGDTPAPILNFAKNGLMLIVPILIAAFVNLDKFNFSARPGGLLYIGAYVLVMVSALLGLINPRRLGLSEQKDSTLSISNVG